MNDLRNARAVLLGLLLCLIGSWATPASAGRTTMMHSGTVVDVDEPPGTFVVAEVGPWRVRDGQTVITHRTVEVTPATELVLVERSDAAPSGYARDFVSSTLTGWSVIPGDFVTIDCLHEGSRLIARRITITYPDTP